MMRTEKQIEEYLSRLRECLPSLSVADREEIIREISVHIRESVEVPGSNLEQILARLGSPETLASQYTGDVIVRRATRSISPVVILRATLHMATRGVQGIALFFLSVLGYALGGGFIIIAIVKPFFPKQTGLWVGSHTFNFTFHTAAFSDPLEHEVLGWWLIPVTLALGGLALSATTYVVRWLLSKMRKPNPSIGEHSAGQTPIVLAL